MHGVRQKSAVLSLVISLAVLLSGCSTIHHLITAPKVTLAPGQQAPTTTMRPVTTTQPTIPITQPCRGFMVTVKDIAHRVFQNTTEYTFSVTNTSGIQCTLAGVFSIRWRNATGAFLPTKEFREGPLRFDHPTATPFSLSNHQVAYFNIGVANKSENNEPCVIAPKASIDPPHKTWPTWITLSPPIHACNGGEVHVSQVFSRTDVEGRQTMAGPLGQGDHGRGTERS